MSKHIFPNHDMEDLFWYFVYKRHEAWTNRHIHGLPQSQWTDDVIIANAKFTNVYRELDRGTQYAIAEIAERRVQNGKQVTIAHLLMYRFFNRIETYEAIRDHITDMIVSGKSIHVEVALRERAITKAKLYTGAYIATYCPNLGGTDAIENATKVLENIAVHSEHIALLVNDNECRLPNVVEIIQKLPGFGDFLAYQSALDMTYRLVYLDGLQIAPYTSQNEWVQLGPGAKAGLSLLGVKGSTATLNRAARELMQDQQNGFDRIGVEFPYVLAFLPTTNDHVKLTLANIEHSLCEFQKYVRMLIGGHVKTLYTKNETESQWRSKYTTTPFWSRVLKGEQIWQR